ncbi:hypothetical protein CFAEC_01430 [Corynebacterium faecale]|nr:hypothetical protein CFAEC_01430 [Corynebacterium faecale]
MVDTLKPASRWGSEAPFHHATLGTPSSSNVTEVLLYESTPEQCSTPSPPISGSTATAYAPDSTPSAPAPKLTPTARKSPARSPHPTAHGSLLKDSPTPNASACWNAKTPSSEWNERSCARPQIIFPARDELVSHFQLACGHRDLYEVKRLCEVLKINRSPYYSWTSAASTRRRRLIDDAVLGARIKTVFTAENGCYGAKRLTAAINADPASEPGNGDRLNHSAPSGCCGRCACSATPKTPGKDHRAYATVS